MKIFVACSLKQKSNKYYLSGEMDKIFVPTEPLENHRLHNIHLNVTSLFFQTSFDFCFTFFISEAAARKDTRKETNTRSSLTSVPTDNGCLFGSFLIEDRKTGAFSE